VAGFYTNLTGGPIPADQPSCVIEQPACAFADRVARISGHYGRRAAARARQLRVEGV
jgi:hypothetical protein